MDGSKNELITNLLKSRNRDFRNFHSLPIVSKANQQQLDTDNLEKGIAFEKFVVRHFDDQYFHLIEWRSDKNVNGISALMNKLPDLEFYFQLGNDTLQFAVECKWGRYFHNYLFDLKDSHLNTYRKYQEVTGHPVFMVIGIGNIATSPREVYIIPLNHITKNKLHEFEMQIYKRSNPDHNFFLDFSRKSLK